MTDKSAPSVGAPPAEAKIAPPAGLGAVPAYDRGWLQRDSRAPFLSYVSDDPAVNWSDDLEELHEESSRTHFIDRWTRKAVIDRLGNPAPNSVIADIGCSTGYMLEDLNVAYPAATLIGVDLVAAGLHKAHELVPDARLLHADACSLPIADQSVDVAVTVNLLEHVPDDGLALREIARILRPGGRMVAVVPAGPRTYDYYDRFLGHERRYAKRELWDKCSGAGLSPVDALHIAALPYPAFWAVKQRNRLLHGRLRDQALADRVAADIAHTKDSRVGTLAWHLEEKIAGLGIKPQFGIRSLVAAARPA
ncbi:MAG TPA: class I SAM-dependent methyltransferase [Solirubrobacteraceae bacterium]|nr:class I SAM-dependent methyltransferase [Solirubrobacteraceae bacterium]